MSVEQAHEALNAALADRDAARQMCQEVRAMLAQSEALRKADPDQKVAPWHTPCSAQRLPVLLRRSLHGSHVCGSDVSTCHVRLQWCV